MRSGERVLLKVVETGGSTPDHHYPVANCAQLLTGANLAVGSVTHLHELAATSTIQPLLTRGQLLNTVTMPDGGGELPELLGSAFQAIDSTPQAARQKTAFFTYWLEDLERAQPISLSQKAEVTSPRCNSRAPLSIRLLCHAPSMHKVPIYNEHRTQLTVSTTASHITAQGP